MSVATLDLSLSINEVVRQHPTTVGVFNSFGLDTCCGGAHPVQEAARRHGIDLATLSAALERATGLAARPRAEKESGHSCGCGCGHGSAA